MGEISPKLLFSGKPPFIFAKVKPLNPKGGLGNNYKLYTINYKL